MPDGANDEYKARMKAFFGSRKTVIIYQGISRKDVFDVSESVVRFFRQQGLSVVLEYDPDLRIAEDIKEEVLETPGIGPKSGVSYWPGKPAASNAGYRSSLLQRTYEQPEHWFPLYMSTRYALRNTTAFTRVPGGHVYNFRHGMGTDEVLLSVNGSLVSQMERRTLELIDLYCKNNRPAQLQDGSEIVIYVDTEPERCMSQLYASSLDGEIPRRFIEAEELARRERYKEVMADIRLVADGPNLVRKEKHELAVAATSDKVKAAGIIPEASDGSSAEEPSLPTMKGGVTLGYLRLLKQRHEQFLRSSLGSDELPKSPYTNVIEVKATDYAANESGTVRTILEAIVAKLAKAT